MATLVCTIEMDKQGGVTVTVADASQDLTQSIAANGTTIVVSMKKGSAQSTITQTEESVVIKCKRFEVDAEETITLNSKKDTSVTSKARLSLSATSDLSAHSDSKVAATAPQVEITGNTAVAIQGAQSSAKLEAGGATVSTPATLSLSAKGPAQVEGATVSVNAKASLALESTALASLSGKLINVQGNLINMG